MIPAGVTSIKGVIFKGCPDEMIVYVEKGSYAETHCSDEELIDDENLRNWDGSVQDKGGEEEDEGEAGDSGDDDEDFFNTP